MVWGGERLEVIRNAPQRGIPSEPDVPDLCISGACT